MTTFLPLTNLHDLAEVLGPMPPGDAPAAWWVSTDPEVLAGWERYRVDTREWHAQWDQLLAISGLPPGTKMATQGLESDILVGLIPPAGVKIPSCWRRNARGQLVPRRRTRAEKASEVNQLFEVCSAIPRPVNYLPGLPKALCTLHAIYPVVVRKPAEAVCAFVGHDPAEADPPFEPDGRWQSMKVSTFMLLRERGEG